MSLFAHCLPNVNMCRFLYRRSKEPSKPKLQNCVEYRTRPNNLSKKSFELQEFQSENDESAQSDHSLNERKRKFLCLKSVDIKKPYIKLPQQFTNDSSDSTRNETSKVLSASNPNQTSSKQTTPKSHSIENQCDIEESRFFFQRLNTEKSLEQVINNLQIVECSDDAEISITSQPMSNSPTYEFGIKTTYNKAKVNDPINTNTFDVNSSSLPLSRSDSTKYITALKKISDEIFNAFKSLCIFRASRLSDLYKEILIYCKTLHPEKNDLSVVNISEQFLNYNDLLLKSPQYEYLTTNMQIFFEVIELFGLTKRFGNFDRPLRKDWSFSLTELFPFISMNYSTTSIESNFDEALSHLPSKNNFDQGKHGRYFGSGKFRGCRKSKKKDRQTTKRNTMTHQTLQETKILQKHHEIHENKKYQYSHNVSSNGSVNVWVRSLLQIPLFKILAILYETDYYNKWVPYCKSCNRLGVLSQGILVVQQLCEYPWPIKQKETITYCFGIDAIDEFGSIFIISSGIPTNSSSFLGVRIPPPTKKIGRVFNSTYFFILTPMESVELTSLELYVNVDIPELKYVLSPIVAAAVIKSVKGFFSKIEQLAKNFEVSSYAKKVENNQELYGYIRDRLDTIYRGDLFDDN